MTILYITGGRRTTTNIIKAQTEALSQQLEKLNEAKTDEEYINELETYQEMLKKADFSLEAQAASKKTKLKWYDKAAPIINRATKQVNKVNKKLEEYNKNRGTK